MRRNVRKKRNFSELEADTLTSEVLGNQEVLFGSIQTGIKRAHKNAVWKRITAAVNRVAAEERTPAEVKKKWSDLKLATKRRVAALERSSTQTGGGQPDPCLPLTSTEEKIASVLGSTTVTFISVGGGDADGVAAKPEKNEPGTSDTAARSPSQSGDGATKPEPVPWQEAEDGPEPSAAPAGPRPLIVVADVLERQTEMCHLLAAVVTSLEAINNTLKEINDNIRK